MKSRLRAAPAIAGAARPLTYSHFGAGLLWGPIMRCRHCEGLVGLGESIVKAVNGEWVHLACATGDGPAPSKLVVTLHQNYYVSVVDPDNTRKRGILLGPFPDYDAAAAQVDHGRRLANDANPWAAFYAYGVSSSNAVFKPVFAEGV